MSASGYRWSFFIAHAGVDLEAAKALYELLKDRAPTFLDDACLELGLDFDTQLSNAQNYSLISVVLVSSHTEEAYYQREEIAAAIDLARDKRRRHRVVPVFLDSDARKSKTVPYGLRLKHGLDLNKIGLDGVADRLIELSRRLENRPETIQPDPKRWRRLLPAPWRYGLAAVTVLGLAALAWVFAPRRDGRIEPEVGQAADVVQRSGPSAGSTLPLVSPADGRCEKVEHYSPNVIPYYLLNSLGSNNFPYWLKIVVRNECNEARILTLRFERGENVALVDPPQKQEFTIPSGTEGQRVFNPRFDLASQKAESVSIHWSIENEYQTKINADVIRTEIVPPLTVAWDLEKPSAPGERVPVEPEYLLGSLNAWILKPPPKVADLGRACRTAPASGVILEREEAIGACYENLFRSDNRVLVSESPIKFPVRPRQRIRPPVDLINEKQNKASSLEAALLFTAVMDVNHKDGVDPNLVMVIGPVEGLRDAERKTAYIAWRETGKPWSAFDLRLVNAKTFEENIASASSHVATIIGYNSEIADAIDNKGAGFSHDGKFAAINFRKIPPEFLIRAMP